MGFSHWPDFLFICRLRRRRPRNCAQAHLPHGIWAFRIGLISCLFAAFGGAGRATVLEAISLSGYRLFAFPGFLVYLPPSAAQAAQVRSTQNAG
jgi:hypothetical protein